MNTLLLIDANALIHRSFHALPPLTTKDGRPGGAIYGLSNILIKILSGTNSHNKTNPLNPPLQGGRGRPDYVAAFFDRPEPTFRKEMYAEYKAQRPKAPDELISQIIEAHNLFKIFGVKTFEMPGFEADDLIGTAAIKFAKEPDLKIIILTGDMDTLQLIHDEKIVVETLKKGISETIIYGETAVKQRYGISPDQMTDYKGLVGDPSDNIPGVKGVGPKTAATIIQKYGSLEEFFQTAEKRGIETLNNAEKNVAQNKDIALFSKKLATIDTNAPLEIKNISELEYAGADVEKITGYFEEMGFQSLVKRITSDTDKHGFKKRIDADRKHDSSKYLRMTPSSHPELGEGSQSQTRQQSIFEHSGLTEAGQKTISKKIIDEIETPLTPILKEMENWGIKTDTKKLAEIGTKLSGELKIITEKIYKEADVVFNINSPKQLLEILKIKFKLKINSTNYDKLTGLKVKPPIIGLILKYRELSKLKGTYIEPLAELAKTDPNGKNRIHPTFVQLKAATGRITCENPNLQNIPEGIRGVFIAEKGYKLASFDYSQIELRILASVTGDKKMIEAFEKNKDIHQITASNIFNVAPDEVTNDMRKLAKTLNFGIAYGMGPRSLSQQSGLTMEEAKKFIKEYFEDFSSIKKWQEQVILKARQDGFVENLNGRVRSLPEITSFNQRFQAEAERMAINFPIQSLAADIIKLAMIKVAERLREKGKWGEKAKMLLTIHDELVFEIKDDADLKKIVELIKETMESVYTLPASPSIGGKVPLVINEGVGDNWGET